MAPLLIASPPSGTGTETSNVALSVGRSLLGYHHQAISGSPTARAPSGVRIQAVNPAATLVEGTPEYCTTTVMAPPSVTGRAGVTTSSWSPFRVYAAGRLFTSTEDTSSTKSRLKLLRS